MSLTSEEVVLKTLELAKKNGIESLDVILIEEKSLALSAQNGEIDSHKVTSGNTVSVRVLHEGRAGISYTEDLSEASLNTMLRSAKQSSNYAEIDAHQKITVGPDRILNLDSKTYVPDYTPTHEKVSLALALEREARARDSKTTAVPYNGYGESCTIRHYGNSNGFYGAERSQSFSAYTSSIMQDGALQALAYESQVKRRFVELDIDDVVERTLNRTRNFLYSKPIPTGNVDVVFDADTLSDFLDVFLGHFSGKSVKDGMSRFTKKIGEQIAHPEFTLKDSPCFERGFSYSLFDAEGERRRELTLVDQGVLKSFYHNSITGSYFGVPSTGHAARGLKGGLGTSLTQLVLGVGSSEEKSVFSGRVLRVQELQGLHSGVNETSGDFSLAIQGELLENGEKVQGVKGVTLSGNFFQMLMQIESIGKVLHSSEDQSFFAPSIRFKDLQLAGSA